MELTWKLCSYKLLRIRYLVILITFIILYTVKTLKSMESHEDLLDKWKRSIVEYGVVCNKEIRQFVPISLKKMDYHRDYNEINYEHERVGTGEQGEPGFLPAADANIEQELYAVNGFNAALSDIISLNRSLPDIRHLGCHSMEYLSDLPTVSVVVPFHNEHWSTLLRTVYSVLNRSPQHLIKEIFLVDDASTKDFLKKKLPVYVKQNLPKVRVLRLPYRSGLITARLVGAKEATADVLVFLDSHSEVNVNWLPPLLEPLALDYRTVVCPFIDVIEHDTFEYRAQDEGGRGVFDWEFCYKRLPVLPKDKENMPNPFPSPVMTGGLFAISRKFFWELGGYDPGLDIWGGEQYELSFKVWQCGGKLLDAPCSRVGHVYKKFGLFPDPGHGDYTSQLTEANTHLEHTTWEYLSASGHLTGVRHALRFMNYKRVAEVWMDEYAEFLYLRLPYTRAMDPGDITEQRALRERLKCKPFQWFMTQIAFDLTARYPPVEPNPYAMGRIRPERNQNMCVDASHGKDGAKLFLKPCRLNASSEQQFTLSWYKDIRLKSRDMCWDLPDSEPYEPILQYQCHLFGGNQLWRFIQDKKLIKKYELADERCLDYDQTTFELFINQCLTKSMTQRWMIDKIDRNMMAQWDDIMKQVTGPVAEF